MGEEAGGAEAGRGAWDKREAEGGAVGRRGGRGGGAPREAWCGMKRMGDQGLGATVYVGEW